MMGTEAGVYKAFKEVGERLGAEAPGTSEVLSSQIQLFATWVAVCGYELAAALEHLDEHQAWLEGWGFPDQVAAAAVERIRGRALALGWDLRVRGDDEEAT